MFGNVLRVQQVRKVASLKRRMRTHLAKGKLKICTRLGAKRIWKSKLSTHTSFGHATSRSGTPPRCEAHLEDFGSQNPQNTSRSGHFWTSQLRKVARRLGVKHIWKSKSSKLTTFGPFLDVATWSLSNQQIHRWTDRLIQIDS